jgi:hypothetical protein
MALHIIKDYTGKLEETGILTIDSTKKAVSFARDIVADNLRLNNPEILTIRIITPSLFRHFNSFLDHPAVTMESIQ